MPDRHRAQDSQIYKTKYKLNSCFVAIRGKSHFGYHLAKSSGLIYLTIFGKHTTELETTSLLSKHSWDWPDRLECIFGKTRHRPPLNKRWAGQQIFPPLEITETQHPRPPVGLFVCLREGQSTAADRCVCSRFKRGSHSEVRHRFAPEGKMRIKAGCPRLTFIHLSPGLIW